MTSLSRVLSEWEKRNATHLPEKSGFPGADFENESPRPLLSFVCAWVSETLTILASLSMELNFPILRIERQKAPECQAVGIFPLPQGPGFRTALKLICPRSPSQCQRDFQRPDETRLFFRMEQSIRYDIRWH